MAKWTLSDYIFQVRSRLDEFDEDTYTDDEITAYLNEAMQKMALDLNKECIVSLDVENKMSVDFRELFIDSVNKLLVDIAERTHNFASLHAFYLNNQRLSPIKPEQVESGLDGFYFWGETMNFKTPKTGTIKAFYIKLPKIMRNSQDTSDLPERFQDIPIEYAIAKAKQKEGEYGLYDYSLNQFHIMRAMMKDELQKQDRTSAVSIITITDFGE